ncbi:MAG: AAA family ATPase [Solobacterium sp.]|nr:AAA family ATPase [Solobacterium sp.]
MDNKNFVGRNDEIKIIEQYYATDKSELIAVYGRRRVGKTYLVRETLKKRFDFEFSGMYEATSLIQREQFQKELNRVAKKNAPTPKDWFEAFDNLKAYLISLKKEKVVVFLDELPWMDTQKSNFLNAFSYFWNSWGKESKVLKLYTCGSATTWMVDKLIGDKGGLYGRVTRPIYLAPFTLLETEHFLNHIKKMNYGRKQVLDTYMIFGGVPYYLDMLDRELPLSINVDNLFFAENAPLKMEYEFLFRSLFNNSANYRKVIERLASKQMGLTREEIEKDTKLTGGELSKILKNLNACDFIRSYLEPNKKQRNKIYQLTDMFSLFHLRFVQKNNGQDKNFWTNMSQTGKKNAWQGYAFEQVCLHHIDQIKTKLGISGILSNVYAWSSKTFVDKNGDEWPSGQIDLIIDRNDNVMNLCEMKYSQDAYSMDKAYAVIIRQRTELFRKTQKTKKDLRSTFITLYGVKKNKYSDIVMNEIILDDLFA